MPRQVSDWNGRSIEVATSRGGVMAVCDFGDNLIREERLPWPPPPVIQKLYESRQSRAFDHLEREAASRTKYSRHLSQLAPPHGGTRGVRPQSVLSSGSMEKDPTSRQADLVRRA
jgi:hypothetical protein